MEQRVYHGNIDPNVLADHLVRSFNQDYSYTGWYGQRYSTMAQKVGQGDHLLVQIARARPWSGRIRGAIGISISKTPDGVVVSGGQSNWLDLTDPSVTGMLIGAVFFPPLLIFPIVRGISNYTFYQDIWNAIDAYAAQVGAAPTDSSVAHGVYCQNCGSVNDEGVEQCHTCGAPLRSSAPQPGYVPTTVQCPTCGTVVPAGKYCNNCAAPLPGSTPS